MPTYSYCIESMRFKAFDLGLRLHEGDMLASDEEVDLSAIGLGLVTSWWWPWLKGITLGFVIGWFVGINMG